MMSATTAPPGRSLRVAVADDDLDTRQYLKEVLSRLGHDVVAAEDGRRLVDLGRIAKPDLIVTDVRMPEVSGLEAAAVANQEMPVPVVLITGHPEADLLQGEGGYVMACLAKPVKPADLVAAITLARKRFEQFQHLAKEAAGLRQALEDRKVIERAKGIAMKRLRVDEEEAFRRLQRAASESNNKLVEIARQLVAADEIFQRLDKV